MLSINEDYDYNGLNAEKIDFLEQFASELDELDNIAPLSQLVQDCKSLPFADYKYMLFTAMQLVQPSVQINEFGRVLSSSELGSVFYDDADNLRSSGLTDRKNPDTVWGQVDELYTIANDTGDVTFIVDDKTISSSQALKYLSSVAQQKQDNKKHILLYVQSPSDKDTLSNILDYVKTLPSACRELLPQVRDAVRQSQGFYKSFCETLGTTTDKLPLQSDD